MFVIGDLLNSLSQYILTICVTIIATMGISLIFKTSNTTNFAQGSIGSLGCYLVANLIIRWCPDVPGIQIIGIIAGIVLGILLGLIIDIGIFRRGKNVNAIGKQIITMGIVTLIIGGIPLIFGATPAPQLLPFISGNFAFDVGGTTVSITKHSLVCLGITVVVIAVLFVLLYKSKWGLGVRATSANEVTAGIIGINTHVITATSWAIAAGLIVLASVMFASGNATLNSIFMTQIQVNSFLGGILGGFSTFYGPIIGAIIIPVVTAIVGWIGIYADFFQKWCDVIVYVLFLIAVLIKPQGLFGKKVIKKV